MAWHDCRYAMETKRKKGFQMTLMKLRLDVPKNYGNLTWLAMLK